MPSETSEDNFKILWRNQKLENHTMNVAAVRARAEILQRRTRLTRLLALILAPASIAFIGWVALVTPVPIAKLGVVITLGTTSSTVLAQYYCQTGWTMQLSGGNTMAVATSNQMCTQRTTDTSVNPPIDTAYTWSAVAFSFTKTGANTGMSTGHLAGPFTASDNTSGTCDLMFNGPLTRN